MYRTTTGGSGEGLDLTAIWSCSAADDVDVTGAGDGFELSLERGRHQRKHHSAEDVDSRPLRSRLRLDYSVLLLLPLCSGETDDKGNRRGQEQAREGTGGGQGRKEGRRAAYRERGSRGGRRHWLLACFFRFQRTGGASACLRSLFLTRLFACNGRGEARRTAACNPKRYRLMSDPQGCFSLKASGSKNKETAPKGPNRVLFISDTVKVEEATMDKVRADDLSQVAARSEKKTSIADKETGKDALIDRKVGEAGSADNAENTQPNERENFTTSLFQESISENEAGCPTGTCRKTPFTSLNQVDADLALARRLQEQERAYMLLRMGSESSDFDSSGSGSYLEEGEDDFEDDFGAEQVDGESRSQWQGSRHSDEEGTREDIDGALFDDDEAYARALQDKEDRETTAMLALAGIHVQGFHDWESADYESESDTSQDMWQDMDPDNMSYEELVALGEAVGTQNKGLTSEAIAALPSSSYLPEKVPNSCGTEQCVICRLEYEEGDAMSTLPCKHLYHSDCIKQWLQINKVCPVCNKEVSADNSVKTPE